MSGGWVLGKWSWGHCNGVSSNKPSFATHSYFHTSFTPHNFTGTLDLSHLHCIHPWATYLTHTHAHTHAHAHTHTRKTHTHNNNKKHAHMHVRKHARMHAHTHTVVSYKLDLSHTFITVIYDLQFLHTHCSMTLSFHTLMSHKADLSYTCYITRLSYTNTLIFHLDLSYIDVSQLSPWSICKMKQRRKLRTICTREKQSKQNKTCIKSYHSRKENLTVSYQKSKIKAVCDVHFVISIQMQL